jgi:putative transposase
MQYVSFSSRKGRHFLHMVFKVKYCHRIFDDKTVQKRCEEIFRQVEAQERKFKIDEIGFDRNHVHTVIDLGPEASEAYVVKKLKGTSAKFLLREFPYLKKNYFWGSGVWNPGYFCESVGDATYDARKLYVKNQGIPRGQTKLGAFFN